MRNRIKYILVGLALVTITACSAKSDADESISEDVSESTEEQYLVKNDEIKDVVDESEDETDENDKQDSQGEESFDPNDLDGENIPINPDNSVELDRYVKFFGEYDYYIAAESDLYVEYKGFTITPETKVIELFEALGYPKRLNEQGFGFYDCYPEKGYQWCLQYPDLDTMDDVRRSYFYIIVKCKDGYHDETVDDRMDGIIQFIHLNCHPTKKGLKVGDKIDDVARLYGKPDNIQVDDGYVYLTYIVGDSDIWIAVNKNSEIVRSIYLEYLKDSSDKFVYERDRAVSAEILY